jgi:SAM-dependent methyltransferase/uncharacterized protein YbaR (Trm112 family)
MNSFEIIDLQFLSILACPRDHSDLHLEGEYFCCSLGHHYPIVGGVPVFLLAEKEQTIGIAKASLEAAESPSNDRFYIETLNISDDERRGVERDLARGGDIDAAISHLVGATSGLGYVEAIGRLESYPIPDIPIEQSSGEFLLDVGSNWGRWSMSAARKGWRAVGIDPSLGALLAAKRASSALSLNTAFVCGDARFLPFKNGVFECAFSYSVIQHFSETDAETAIAELGRVLRPNGFAKIQMAHKGGLRSTYSRTRPDYQQGGPFRVRYWSLAAMRRVFESRIGPSTLLAEAFGGLGLLAEDSKYVSMKAKILIAISTFLKKLSVVVRPMVRFADSVYVVATKQ